MSKREKAEWSLTREDWYKSECNKMLFDKKMTLTIDENTVYLKSADKEELLLEITQPKKMWFEIWSRLKAV